MAEWSFWVLVDRDEEDSFFFSKRTGMVHIYDTREEAREAKRRLKREGFHPVVRKASLRIIPG